MSVHATQWNVREAICNRINKVQVLFSLERPPVRPSPQGPGASSCIGAAKNFGVRGLSLNSEFCLFFDFFNLLKTTSTAA